MIIWQTIHLSQGQTLKNNYVVSRNIALNKPARLPVVYVDLCIQKINKYDVITAPRR